MEIGAKTKYELTPEELIREVRKYKNFIKSGGVTCTGGEPLLQAEFVEAFFNLCRAEGIQHRLLLKATFCSAQTKLNSLP